MGMQNDRNLMAEIVVSCIWKICLLECFPITFVCIGNPLISIAFCPHVHIHVTTCTSKDQFKKAASVAHRWTNRGAEGAQAPTPIERWGGGEPPHLSNVYTFQYALHNKKKLQNYYCIAGNVCMVLILVYFVSILYAKINTTKIWMFESFARTLTSTRAVNMASFTCVLPNLWVAYPEIYQHQSCDHNRR